MNFTFWSAVAIAGLVGSLHCAGMCGPIAALASGASQRCDSATGCESKRRPRGMTACYQAGRLLTYLIIGLVAGSLGAALDLGGNLIGWQRGAAWLAGLTSVGIGAAVLVRMWWGKYFHLPLPKFLTQIIVSVRKLSATWSPRRRAWALGMVTGLLPCGWLYTFVLVAAGTGTPWSGMLVMGLLWAGAVPVLVSLGLSAGFLAPRLSRHATWITALIVILVGVTTIRSRASAAWEPWLSSLKPAVGELDASFVREIANEKKPCCCEAGAESCETSTAETDKATERGSQGS